ncbi:hypothetical protein D9757_000281 [Collybiopsis confluens]|uniref:Secreted protein n=1 Tax=Collybiopsis confluens TaxID=2823264 RepID=A0A8H5I2N2_9AGAR|nr:hypothetical protein D9757_000281 [Collybiopsis confluens]
MLALACSSLLVTLLFVYLFMPGLLLASDDDVLELSPAVVAARNPFRESGPPANMAKLILLRHKIQTTNRKHKRSPSQSCQPVRTYTIPQPRAAKAPWLRFGRSFGKQYH